MADSAPAPAAAVAPKKKALSNFFAKNKKKPQCVVVGTRKPALEAARAPRMRSTPGSMRSLLLAAPLAFGRSDESAAAAATQVAASDASRTPSLLAVPAGALAAGDWVEEIAAPVQTAVHHVSALRARVTEVTDEEMDLLMGERRGA